MFENLTQVEHPNIVKFHKYWLDMTESRARVRLKTHLVEMCELYPKFRHSRVLSFRATQVIFITEYMSSGSLKQFLKKTKKNHKNMNVKVRCFISH